MGRAWCAISVSRVTHSGTNGFLTGVSEGATTLASLGYHPNTMLSEVVHSNGTIDTFAKDPNNMLRPASITEGCQVRS